MGTKMAPSYANIFMGDLEERLLLSSLKQPFSWFRFIDDVDMKWTHSGAYSLYPNGLAERDTLKTVLRMAITG
jgi:hypothetical protein